MRLHVRQQLLEIPYGSMWLHSKFQMHEHHKLRDFSFVEADVSDSFPTQIGHDKSSRLCLLHSDVLEALESMTARAKKNPLRPKTISQTGERRGRWTGRTGDWWQRGGENKPFCMVRVWLHCWLLCLQHQAGQRSQNYRYMYFLYKSLHSSTCDMDDSREVASNLRPQTKQRCFLTGATNKR